MKNKEVINMNLSKENMYLFGFIFFRPSISKVYRKHYINENRLFVLLSIVLPSVDSDPFMKGQQSDKTRQSAIRKLLSGVMTKYKIIELLEELERNEFITRHEIRSKTGKGTKGIYYSLTNKGKIVIQDYTTEMMTKAQDRLKWFTEEQIKGLNIDL